MCRFFVLLMTAIILSTLYSCAKPVETEVDNISLHTVFLKDLGNGVCHQLPSGLMWQIDTSENFFNFQDAREYANKLELGGFNDWRLPTRDECFTLSTLLFMKKGNCPIKIKKGHWVTENRKGKSGFWDDYPLCGGPEFHWIKTTNGYVRAVRP